MSRRPVSPISTSGGETQRITSSLDYAMNRLGIAAVALALVGSVALSVYPASEIQRTKWSGRVLAFVTQQDSVQPPLRRPSIFSAEGDPVPAARTFGRKGRVIGILLEDSQSFLVVDMLDTNERLYFYYGGRFGSDNLPSVPMGTRFEDHPTTASTQKEKAPAPHKSRRKASKSSKLPQAGSTPSTGDGGWVLPVLLMALLAFILKQVLKTGKKDLPADVRETRAAETPGLRITISTGSYGDGYRVTSTDGDRFWKPAGQFSRVAGFDIGGMVYVGSGRGAVGGGAEPALIDPKLPVASDIDECSTRRLSYWPSYCSASPEARASVLRWLGTGCKDPDADMGYVFIYFYGLERRVLHDAKSSAQAKADIPAIRQEIERLLAIYDNRSFQFYAQSLLDFLRAQNTSGKLYEGPPPDLPRGRYLAFSHRLGLAQCAADDRPLPAEWALVWLMGDPNTSLRTPARRCPEEFKGIFLQKYREQCGEGLKLPQNKARLKLEYRPASAGFGHNSSGLGVQFALPDVSALSSPVKKLQTIADSCYPELEAYSRLIGKDRTGARTFEAIMELPVFLWPEQYREPVLRAQSTTTKAGGFMQIPFSEFRSWFPEWQTVIQDKYEALCRALSGASLGIEPDPRFGGSLPTDSSSIVLFTIDGHISEQPMNPRYSAAVLTLHLAAAVAFADGVVSDVEKRLLMKQLEGWLHLSDSERRRLNANSRRLLTEPPKLSGLTKRIAILDRPARESLGNFLALVAYADEKVTPEEVKILEKIFKLLGLDSKAVYSSVHAAASEPITVRPAEADGQGFIVPKPPKKPETSFKLDAAKVKALMADSERVAAILGSVFETAGPPAQAAKPEPDGGSGDQARTPSFLGLDAEHGAFARVLLTRTCWSRPELEEISRDHGLPLDGAMEHINDAAFEKFDKPLCEGTDTIELNPEILKELTHDEYQAA